MHLLLENRSGHRLVCPVINLGVHPMPSPKSGNSANQASNLGDQPRNSHSVRASGSETLVGPWNEGLAIRMNSMVGTCYFQLEWFDEFNGPPIAQ